MEDLAASNPKVAPNRVAFNVVMGACVKQGDLTRASELLERMRVTPGVQPHTNDYNMLLVAYAQLGQARKAEEIMKRMVDQCREDHANTSAPDLLSYNMLLGAWAKSGETGAGERAQEILTMLQQRCISGETLFQPDVRTYSHVANAIIRSGGVAKNVAAAQSILEQALAMGITPDVYLHSTLLDAYASSSEPGVAIKAEERLNAMEQQGIVDSVAYNTVIKAWKQSPDQGAAQRAEAILMRMESLGIADTISYTAVISAYGIKGDRPSAIRAEELYERMAKSYEGGNVQVKPNTQTLNACTYCRGS
jgi:pentatricopeptide repeat protein